MLAPHERDREDPSFGMSVMRTVARRLAANGPFDIGASDPVH